MCSAHGSPAANQKLTEQPQVGITPIKQQDWVVNASFRTNSAAFHADAEQRLQPRLHRVGEMGVDDRHAGEAHAERIHRLSALPHFEMQVRAGREAGRADIADQLPRVDEAARLRRRSRSCGRRRLTRPPPCAIWTCAAIAAGPAGADDLAVRRGDDRAAPARADVDPGVKAGEVQDRVIAIAEIGGDRAVRPASVMPLSTGCGSLGVGGVDPFAAAVRVPAHQLKLALRRRGRARRRAGSRLAPEHQVEAVARARRRRRRSRSPARRDIARRPAATRRPRAATSRARRRPGRGCAAGPSRHWRRLRRSRRPAAAATARFGTKSTGSDRLGRRHRACRSRRRSTAARSPAPATAAARRREARRRRGKRRPGNAAAQQREHARALPARTRPARASATRSPAGRMRRSASVTSTRRR